MAAIVQQTNSGLVTLNTTPNNINFAGAVTPGNAIIIVVAMPNAVAGSTSATHNGVSLVKNAEASGGTTSAILSLRDVQSASTTVPVASTVSATNSVVFLFEVSGLDNSAAVLSGSKDDGSNVTNHTCTDTPISGSGFAVCGGASSDINAHTAGTDWTKATTPSEPRFCQYRFTPDDPALSNNVGDYTSAAQRNNSVIALFADEEEVAAGNPFITQLDCKRI